MRRSAFPPASSARPARATAPSRDPRRRHVRPADVGRGPAAVREGQEVDLIGGNIKEET